MKYELKEKYSKTIYHPTSFPGYAWRVEEHVNNGTPTYFVQKSDGLLKNESIIIYWDTCEIFYDEKSALEYINKN